MITSPIKIRRIASTAFRLRTITDHFQSLEVVDRASETQLQVTEKFESPRWLTVSGNITNKYGISYLHHQYRRCCTYVEPALGYYHVFYTIWSIYPHATGPSETRPRIKALKVFDILLQNASYFLSFQTVPDEPPVTSGKPSGRFSHQGGKQPLSEDPRLCLSRPSALKKFPYLTKCCKYLSLTLPPPSSHLNRGCEKEVEACERFW